MACRSLERGNKAAEEIMQNTGADRLQVTVMRLDLSSLKSIKDFVSEFKKSELLGVIISSHLLDKSPKL